MRYLYRRAPSMMKIVSDEPIEDDRYILVSSWEDADSPPPAANLEPLPADVSEIPEITRAGGPWYDVEISSGNTVRVNGAERALAEWRKSRR